MALNISMYTAAFFGGNTHLRQRLLHLVIRKLLVTQIRFANAARNHRGSFRHRQVALAKQLARLFAGKIQVQEALRGVVADVARRDHGQLQVG